MGVAMTGSSAGGVDRISAGERIASLDVLRGIAILFILFMNIPWMAGYAPFLRDPRVVSWTAFDPSASPTHNSNSPERLEKKAIRLPSGERAGN